MAKLNPIAPCQFVQQLITRQLNWLRGVNYLRPYVGLQIVDVFEEHIAIVRG
jgi:hypothetical protein